MAVIQKVTQTKEVLVIDRETLILWIYQELPRKSPGMGNADIIRAVLDLIDEASFTLQSPVPTQSDVGKVPSGLTYGYDKGPFP